MTAELGPISMTGALATQGGLELQKQHDETTRRLEGEHIPEQMGYALVRLQRALSLGLQQTIPNTLTQPRTMRLETTGLTGALRATTTTLAERESREPQEFLPGVFAFLLDASASHESGSTAYSGKTQRMMEVDNLVAMGDALSNLSSSAPFDIQTVMIAHSLDINSVRQGNFPGEELLHNPLMGKIVKLLAKGFSSEDTEGSMQLIKNSIYHGGGTEIQPGLQLLKSTIESNPQLAQDLREGKKTFTAFIGGDGIIHDLTDQTVEQLFFDLMQTYHVQFVGLLQDNSSLPHLSRDIFSAYATNVHYTPGPKETVAGILAQATALEEQYGLTEFTQDDFNRVMSPQTTGLGTTRRLVTAGLTGGLQ